MPKTNNIFLYITLLLLNTTILYPNISGTVFQDIPVNNQTLNTYGVQDSNELGVPDITVTAYPEKIHTITDINGSWSLSTTKDSRIEFSNIPSYLKESVKGNLNNSSVQFIPNNSTNINFALHNPADFSNTANPLYVSNLQQNGTHDNSIVQNLQTVHYNASGLNADFRTDTNVQGTGEIPQDNILMDKLGSVWAKAYQKNKKRLFVASMLQRHVGFANTPADIYVTDYTTGTPSTLLGNFSLQGKAPSNGGVNIDLGVVDRSSGPDYTLTADPLLQNIDLDSYAKVGKISYGGVDIDHNTNTLWTLNLNQKGIISIDISGDFNSLSTATTNQYLISNLNNKPICTNGELRPWALKIHKGRGYIGAVCDAYISLSRNDLSAHIFSFDLSKPSLGFTKELDFQLDYKRQLRRWYAWENSYFDPSYPKAYNGVIYGQPVLSDIEFDKSNNMYIAFFDRYSTQLGTGNYRAISGTVETERSYEYGEILKVCDTNGTYEREGTGNCLQSNYTDLGISEFFNDQGGDRNRESSLGALAILKGSNQLLLTTTDPHPESTTGATNSTYWFTQGTHTLSTANGSIQNWYANAYTGANGLNAKANGLGDIELITEAAPIEIGDRVWLDSNANGVQDANETGISGVKVNLVCDNTVVVATALTDASGNYIFSNDPNAISSSSHIYNISQLMENNDSCLIQVPNIKGTNKQNALNNNVLTSINSGEGNNSNLNDSNGITDNNHSKAIILASDIPIAGHNNHSFDIGFKPDTNRYTLGDRVWLDSNNNGIQDTNETGANNINVTLYNSTDCTGASTATTTTTNGLYQFTNLLAGTYCIAFSNLPANHNISSANQGSNNALDSNANSNAQITNITLTSNDNAQDMGIYSNLLVVNPTPPVANPTPTVVNPTPTVQIGNRVWIENDNDGNASTGIITPVVGQLVTATSSDGTQYTAITDSNGTYLITVPQNDTYIVSVNVPNNYIPTGSSHDSRGTTVVITDTDNLTVDFGFRLTDVLAVTSCQEMILNDDTKPANELNATTTIDVLNNDIGTKSGQEIKFLSLVEGEALWENQSQNISSVTTHNTLTVEGEGTWSVIDNKVVFNALPSFDGQVPTPIYYIIEGSNCTEETRFTNVARVSINTPCHCPSYSTKSIDALNIASILLLILLTTSITLLNFRRELKA